jgi:acyl carrier protein
VSSPRLGRDELLALVYDAIDEFNASLPEGRPIEKRPDSALYEAGGPLDSLGLVHLIVSLEQRVLDKTGLGVALADEKAFSTSRSPFRDVSSLLRHLEERIEDGSRAR